MNPFAYNPDVLICVESIIPYAGVETDLKDAELIGSFEWSECKTYAGRYDLYRITSERDVNYLLHRTRAHECRIGDLVIAYKAKGATQRTTTYRTRVASHPVKQLAAFFENIAHERSKE